MSLPKNQMSAFLAGVSSSGCPVRIRAQKGIVGSTDGEYTRYLDGSDEFPVIVPGLKNVNGASALMVVDEIGRLHKIGRLQDIGNGVVVFEAGKVAVKPLGSPLVSLDASLIKDSSCGAEFVGMESCNTPGKATLVRMNAAMALSKMGFCGLPVVDTIPDGTDVIVFVCSEGGVRRLRLSKEIFARFTSQTTESGMKAISRVPLVRQYAGSGGINSYVDGGEAIGSSSGTINLGTHGVPNSASIVYLLLQAGVAINNQSTATSQISINGVTWAHAGMTVISAGASDVDRICYVAPIPITDLSMTYNVALSASGDDAAMACISLVGYYVP